MIDRDALIATNVPYVTRLASQLAVELKVHVPLDDLASAGREGLVDAARRYDPARGAQFTTYAHYRIRGAMLDHVREAASQDPRARARAAAHAAVDDLVEQRLAESPAPDAGAAAIALAGALDDIAAAFTMAEIAAATTPSPPEDPESASLSREQRRALDGAISALPEREAAMVRAVYFEGRSIEQAGRDLGLSKSWSSRLHAKALALLRARLAGLEAAL